MDAHGATTVTAGLVELIDRVHGRLDRFPGELVPQHENADVPVRRPVTADGLLHARNGIRLTEGAPIAGAPADFLALLRTVDEPFAARAGKHVLPLIVHHL